MSVYSGFATRNQEQCYDNIIYNVISTLLVRLVKFYQGQSIDQRNFQKILSRQQKILKKMEKRKYLEPKYAELLEQFLKTYDGQQQQFTNKQPSLPKDPRQFTQMHRTFSLLDRQMHQLKQGAEKFMSQAQVHEPHRKLSKIEQIIPKPSKKKRSKSKKLSIKSNLDIWEMRKQKSPQLPSLHPIQHTMLTKTNFNLKKDNSRIGMTGRQGKINYEEQQIQGISAGKKTLYKTKNQQFRANMFFR